MTIVNTIIAIVLFIIGIFLIVTAEFDFGIGLIVGAIFCLTALGMVGINIIKI